MNLTNILGFLSQMVHNFIHGPNRDTAPAPASQCPTDDQVERAGLAPCQSKDGDNGGLKDPYAGMDYEDWVVAQRHAQFSPRLM